MKQLPLIVPLVMRLFLTSIFSAILFSTPSFSQEPEKTDSTKQVHASKYYHNVQLGSTIITVEFGTFPFFDLATCHGINFNKRFSAGIGISTMYFMTLTPFVQGRFNFREQGKSKKSIPYLSLKAGYLIFLTNSDSDQNCLNIEPCLGYSFVGKKGKNAWEIFIAGNYLIDKIYPKIGVGFQF